jgi:hypothetical protein
VYRAAVSWVGVMPSKDEAQCQFDAMVQELDQAGVSVRYEVNGQHGFDEVKAKCPAHPRDMLLIERLESTFGYPEPSCTSRENCTWEQRLDDAIDRARAMGPSHSVDAGAASPAPKQKPQAPKPEPGSWQQERWQRAVSDDSRVTGGCLGVALLISTEARRVDGTRAMISNDRIAKAFAIDRSTVKRHTQRLRQLGYLKVAHKGHRRGDGLPTANVYDLCLPDSQGLTHEP